MARYTDAVCRLCRRVEEKIFLKGERCLTPRCAVERRRRLPGDRTFRRRRASDRAIQLREKQKARFIYGVLERQFRKYFDDAHRSPGNTGELLLQRLERRLDNVVYRLGFADSRRQGRQLVLHGHLAVNGRKVNIPSFTVKVGDVITWRSNGTQKDFVKELTAGIPKRPVPSWLSLDPGALIGKVLSPPLPSEIDATIDTRLITEYYSR